MSLSDRRCHAKLPACGLVDQLLFEHQPRKPSITNFDLLGLPPEIIAQVLQAILVKNDPVIVGCPVNSRWYMYHSARSSQILRVCKRLHEEGIEILYGQNVFRYNGNFISKKQFIVTRYRSAFNPMHLIRELSVDYCETSLVNFTCYRRLRKVTFRYMTECRSANDSDLSLLDDKRVMRILELTCDPLFDQIEVFIEFKEHADVGEHPKQAICRSRRINMKKLLEY